MQEDMMKKSEQEIRERSTRIDGEKGILIYITIFCKYFIYLQTMFLVVFVAIQY